MSTALASVRSRLVSSVRIGPDDARRRVRAIATAAGAVAAWFVLDQVLPKGVPLGEVVVRGSVIGSLYALGAIGLILVFRANRIVNFSQAELGSVAAVLAIEMVIKLKVNYFLALGTGVAAAVLTGVIIDLVVIRAFRAAPRLILAVATIGVAQILNGLAIQVPLWFAGGAGIDTVGQQEFTTPFTWHFNIGVARFFGDHIFVMILVPLVILGLTAFLRYTDYGVAIRASAENADRANLLGMPVGRLSTVVWGIAGLMSAIAVILRVQIIGFSSFTGVSGGGSSLLLRTLAAAVVARMESMPMAAAAAVGIGILESEANWTWGNGTYADALLVVVILVALMAQRGHFTRASETGISSWRALREVRPIPHELRNVPEVKYGLMGLGGLLAAFVVLFPLWASADREQLVAVIFIYAIVAVSLVVLTGWVGQISLGQWAFVGFGAATTSVLIGRYQVDLFVSLLAGMAVAAIAALVIGIPALRISGPFLAVTTLAFAVTARTFLLEDRYIPILTQEQIARPVLLQRLPITLDWQFYYFCLAFLVLAYVAARNIRRSRTGRALVAVRDNEPAAQAASLNVPLLKLTAFAISGAFAGLAGGLYMLHQSGLNTDSYGPEVSLLLFTMVVIGGLGSLPGAILGAVWVSVFQFFVGGGWALLASGAGILFILLFLPGGLGAGMYRVRDELLRWIADRRGIVVPSLLADIRQEKLEEEKAVALEDVLARVREGQTANGGRAGVVGTKGRRA